MFCFGGFIVLFCGLLVTVKSSLVRHNIHVRTEILSKQDTVNNHKNPGKLVNLQSYTHCFIPLKCDVSENM